MKKGILFIVLAAMVMTGCRQVFGKRMRGNGNITSQTRNVSGFDRIDIGGAADLYIKQDSVFSIRIEGDENLLPYLETVKEGNTLHIHETDNMNLRTTRGFKVYVSAPQFTEFQVSGACDLYSENQIQSSQKIRIRLSGASDVEMDVKSPMVEADLSGAGTIKLKGEAKDFDVDGSGSTDIKCYDLLTENTKVEISGAGSAQVSASVKLDVRVSGAGSVHYKGNPAVSQSVSGAGSVSKAN